ncbi:hypothetical protein E2C01_069826 [Portunus trituberculatus]|uniref:Uncharacterized protein n=1 Tax=Portunus trituberculatus TaxID=210409 RepID=A0A5B7I0K5_PORTR|nr:hypothetical protein [Portunus trituberculatus]
MGERQREEPLPEARGLWPPRLACPLAANSSMQLRWITGGSSASELVNVVGVARERKRWWSSG